jgi:hypothetical protein
MAFIFQRPTMPNTIFFTRKSRFFKTFGDNQEQVSSCLQNPEKGIKFSLNWVAEKFSLIRSIKLGHVCLQEVAQSAVNYAL